MKGAITMKGWTGFCALLFVNVCPCIAETSSSDCTPPVIRFPNRDIELDVSDTSATVPFEIIGDCFYKIEIYEEGKSDTKDCRIRSGITNYGVKCSCTTTDKNFSCSITGVFTRQSEENTLTVKVQTQQSEITTYVPFNVTSPTILKDFYVIHYKNQSVVTVKKTPNLKLHFYCSWTTWNWKPTIEFHGPKNSSVIRTANNVYRHTLYNMSCDNSGEYRCQVKGTDHFKSLTLLIKCPLGFKQPSSTPQQSVQTGADAKWSFNATSYTKELESCQLRKSDGTSGFACNSSRSVVNVLGSAPHLLLTVTLYNVTKADDGAWNLIASNPTKPGPAPVSSHVQFRLIVTETIASSSERADTTTPTVTSGLYTSRETSTPLDSEEAATTAVPSSAKYDPGASYLGLAIGVSVALGIVLIVVVIIVIWLWRRQWKLPCADVGNNVDSNSQPAVDPDDYLEPVPRIEEAPGPYESLQMADVGLRSVYSGISSQGRPSTTNANQDGVLYENTIAARK